MATGQQNREHSRKQKSKANHKFGDPKRVVVSKESKSRVLMTQRITRYAKWPESVKEEWAKPERLGKPGRIEPKALGYFWIFPLRTPPPNR
jgi:hypothetical protein